MTSEARTIVSAADFAGEPARALIDAPAIERAVAEILGALGEDPERAGLVDTPRRVAESYAELFSGYAVDPVELLDPLAGERASGMIMVRDIDVIGVCEHHLLPFVGTAAVAYLPNDDGRITGLSKLARLIEVLSRRLQVQERLVRETGDALEAALAPRASFVLVEAEHLCMTVRGARKPGSVTVTTDVRGAWDEPAARAELLSLARGK